MNISSPDRLVDNYQRQINYLRISITDRCNLNCIYCSPERVVEMLPSAEILSYEEILRLVRVSTGLGVKKVRVTGGEPLLRKGIVEFIRELTRVEGIGDIGLTTNGTLLSEFALPLRQAGLKRVNVSLDTMVPEKYRSITRRDGLERVLAGIERAEEAGFSRIKVNAVLIRGINEGEIISFAEFAYSRGVEVRFIEYMPYLNGSEGTADLYIQAGEVREIISSRFRLIPLPGDERGSVAETYQLEGSEGVIGLVTPVSRHFCERCNRIRLTADGKLRNCLFSDDEIDIKGPMRAGRPDSELAEIIRKSVKNKPRRHPDLFFAFKKCTRTMNLIGG